MKTLFLSIFVLILSGCGVSGDSGVEIAPYKVLRSAEAQNIELRNYDSMVLVSAPMDDEGRNNAFGALFDYISGENVEADKISMTAPVFVDQDVDAGVKIPMTAPVFMDDEGSAKRMYFVMPADMSLRETPKPINPDVRVEEVEDYNVAVIRFSGRLTEKNITKHRRILEQWILDNDLTVIGPIKSAGYNAPFTLPSLRRNEVLIPVAKKN